MEESRPEWSEYEVIERAIEAGNVDFGLVVRLSSWRSPVLIEDAERRRQGARLYPLALTKFKAQDPAGQVALFRDLRAGVNLKGDLDLLTMIAGEVPLFDWGRAQLVISHLDSVAQEARQFLSQEIARRSVVEQVYGVTTAVMAAVDRENRRIRAAAGAGEVPGGSPLGPSELHEVEVHRLEEQARAVTGRFAVMAGRAAEARYAKGMLIGGVGVFVLCAMLGAIFMSCDIAAVNAVGIPAGAIGAAVSVLQRMTNEGLQLDYRSASRLTWFGAFRPVVGAVFGMFILLVIRGGLLPLDIPEDDGAELALVAVFGFIAGFNERFAQDMLGKAQSQIEQVDPSQPPRAEAR